MFLDHDAAGWAILGLAWFLHLAVYAGITLGLARLGGAAVEEVSIGYGPTPIRWRCAGTTFRLGPLPIGASVKLLGLDDDQLVSGCRYSELPLTTRLGLHLAGHLTNLAIALAILGLGPSAKLSHQVGLLVAGNSLLNLLPLPAFAGGRVIFEVWAAIRHESTESSRDSKLYVAAVLLSIPVGFALLTAIGYFVLVRYDDLVAMLAAIGIRL
jgi:membrane-associated protease RseP (regulator of RpoE activity)